MDGALGRGRGRGGSLVGGGGRRLEVELEPPLLAEQGEGDAWRLRNRSSTVARSGAAEEESRAEAILRG